MKIITIILFFSLYINSIAQHNNTQAALYNIGFGGITSSIGAVLNKKPNEKLGKVLLKGFWQGALGGTVVYGSKQLVYNMHKKHNLDKLWQAKLVNSVGVSIIENAGLNQNFYDKWHINIGFNRLEVDIKNNFKVQYKIMPTALIGTIISTTHGSLNLKYSIQTLTPIFLNKNEYAFPFAIINSIVINKDKMKNSLAHEIIHTFQIDDFMSINVFFNKKKKKWTTHSKLINKYNKWFYMDTPSFILLRSVYLIENKNIQCYYDNFFEAEANYYSSKVHCK